MSRNTESRSSLTSQKHTLSTVTLSRRNHGSLPRNHTGSKFTIKKNTGSRNKFIFRDLNTFGTTQKIRGLSSAKKKIDIIQEQLISLQKDNFMSSNTRFSYIMQ